jgi:hypothetical protein
MRSTTIGTGSPAAREVSVISLGAMRFGTMTDEATSFAIPAHGRTGLADRR